MVAEKQQGYFGQSMRTHNHVERKTIPLRSDPNNFSMSRKLPVFVLDLSGPKKSSSPAPVSSMLLMEGCSTGT